MARITDPGKFEGETTATLYAYSLTLNGDGELYSDGDGEASYTAIDGPFDSDSILDYQDQAASDERLDTVEIVDIMHACGVIVREGPQGFVDAEWYTDDAALNAAVNRLERIYNGA